MEPVLRSCLHTVAEIMFVLGTIMCAQLHSLSQAQGRRG